MSSNKAASPRAVPARGIAGPARKKSATPGAAVTPGKPAKRASGAPAAVGQPVNLLGTRLKHARMVRGLTLKALASAASCSESMLSKIEHGVATPSIATLHRLGLALSTNIAGLISTEEISTSPVQRAGERAIISFPSSRRRGAIKLERVIVPAQGQLLQGDIHVIEPLVSSDEQISHAGEESGYVIEGVLELKLVDEIYRLDPGDTFYFNSSLPHSYRNPGAVLTRVWWINTPPTF
jgi:transcriptional regulator with XRE-family HTH domain